MTANCRDRPTLLPSPNSFVFIPKIPVIQVSGSYGNHVSSGFYRHAKDRGTYKDNARDCEHHDASCLVDVLPRFDLGPPSLRKAVLLPFQAERVPDRRLHTRCSALQVLQDIKAVYDFPSQGVGIATESDILVRDLIVLLACLGQVDKLSHHFFLGSPDLHHRL